MVSFVTFFTLCGSIIFIAINTFVFFGICYHIYGIGLEKSRTETEHWAAENDEDLRLVSVIDGYIEYAFCNYVIKALFKYKVLFALFFLFFM